VRDPDLKLGMKGQTKTMSKALATKKVAAVLLGLGMVLAFAGAASAQTTTTTTTNSSTLSALQAQVQALLAQIASLQGTGTATASGACFTFTENEQMGSSGGQVMWIQEFLNGHGFTVAASGAGSPGNESSYFGALTKAAVIKFQDAYASSILTPEGLTSGTGNWFAGTRAEANAICAGSTTTTTTTTTGTTGNGTGITVTAGTQPANSLAPANANRVPFTTFTITNTSGAAVTINGVDVQRTGLAADAAFAGVVLLDPNGVQIGTSRTFNSNHQAELGTPFTLNAGQSETFTVAGNMGTQTVEQNYSGQVASISVVGIDTTVPVSGTLPITGAQQTINSSLTIGTANVTLSSFDPNSSRTEPIGTTGLIFSGVRIQAGSAENEKLYSITWNQTGSIGSGDLSNLVTIVNGTSYPMTVDSTGKYYTATFPGGISVNEGNSIDAYVQGDITGSDAAGRTIEFDVYRPSDIYLVGQTYGYGITPTASNSTNAYSTNNNTSSGFQASANPFYFGSTATVTAGTLSTISSAGSVGSQNIAINVQNQPLGGFSTDFTGEPVTVQSLTFHVASSTAGVQLENVSLVDSNGNVVAGPVNETDSTATIVFNSSVTFPVGAMTYTLKGTVAPTQDTTGANTSTLGAITYQVSFNPGGTSGSNGDWTGSQGETSGSSVSLPETTITMSTMTVQGGSLTITAASTPAATTVAPGANNFVVANINLDASQSGEDIRINSLPIVIDSTSTTNAGAVTVLKSNLSNCQLWNGSTVLNSQSIGSGQWNVVALTGTGNPLTGPEGLEANFVFQNSLTVPKGTVVTLSVECNVSSSLYNGAKFAAGVDHAYLPSPVGAQSGNSITPTITNNSVSGVMTVGSASLAASNPTPISYTQVAGGTTGVTVGTFTLQPTSDSVNLQNIALALNSNYASSSDAASFQIWDGSTQIGTVNFQTVAPATFDEGGNFYVATTSVSSVNVPQNTQTVFTIKANVNQIGTGQAATSNHEFRVSLANAQGVGASSGTSVNSGVSATSTTGVAIFRSYPTVAASSYLPSNGVADGRLIAFSVTANANGPVGVNQFAFGISTSSITTLSGLSLYAYTDSGFSQAAGGTVNGIAGTTNYNGETQQATTTMATPLEIPAGTTEYFLLKGTVSPANSTSYNIATTLKGDSTDLAPNMSTVAALNTADVSMIWSPNSTTTSPTTGVDWTSGYGVSGLPSIGLTENRTN
jgi:hypothetical protein